MNLLLDEIIFNPFDLKVRNLESKLTVKKVDFFQKKNNNKTLMKTQQVRGAQEVNFILYILVSSFKLRFQDSKILISDFFLTVRMA